jgi:hypothetical protein
MRAAVLIGVLVFGGAGAAAAAADCRGWLRLDAEGRRAEVGGMINGHLSSHASKRYTSENRVAIQRCLKGFVGEIVEEIDAACEERPNANAEYVDDIFDRYFLSCI